MRAEPYLAGYNYINMPSVTGMSGKSGGVIIYYKEELAVEKLDLDVQNFTSHSEIIAVKARKFATILYSFTAI